MSGDAAGAILAMGAAELAGRIRAGEVTSEAATAAVLAALDGPGRRLLATARLHAEGALEDARARDRERAEGRAVGPLHGVPLAHKDMFHRAGRPSAMGSTARAGFVPEATATVLLKLDAAGAVDVGRLNMVEFALGVTGHNDHTGHPRNAWDPARVTGGSTSGGATAVAARLVPATLGSDTGGSIRVPAAMCGLVGLKPTYGRVSRARAMPLSFSLDHVGPLARSAEDVALLLEVLAGPDPLDPSTSPRPVPRYGDALRAAAAAAGGLAGVRVALPRDGFDVAVEPGVEALWAGAAGVLRDLGARVDERRLPAFAPLNALRRAVAVVEIAALHRERLRTRRADYNATTLCRMLVGYGIDGADYLRALSARGPLLRGFCREAFADADVLALPVLPEATPTIAELDTRGDPRYVDASNRLGALVGPFNYLGLPALATPMGFDAGGCPAGLQLVAPPFAEGLLLRVADAFERATGWAARRPPAPPPATAA